MIMGRARTNTFNPNSRAEIKEMQTKQRDRDPYIYEQRSRRAMAQNWRAKPRFDNAFAIPKAKGDVARQMAILRVAREQRKREETEALNLKGPIEGTISMGDGIEADGTMDWGRHSVLRSKSSMATTSDERYLALLPHSSVELAPIAQRSASTEPSGLAPLSASQQLFGGLVPEHAISTAPRVKTPEDGDPNIEGRPPLPPSRQGRGDTPASRTRTPLSPIRGGSAEAGGPSSKAVDPQEDGGTFSANQTPAKPPSAGAGSQHRSAASSRALTPLEGSTRLTVRTANSSILSSRAATPNTDLLTAVDFSEGRRLNPKEYEKMTGIRVHVNPSGARGAIESHPVPKKTHSPALEAVLEEERSAPCKAKEAHDTLVHSRVVHREERVYPYADDAPRSPKALKKWHRKQQDPIELVDQLRRVGLDLGQLYRAQQQRDGSTDNAFALAHGLDKGQLAFWLEGGCPESAEKIKRCVAQYVAKTFLRGPNEVEETPVSALQKSQQPDVSGHPQPIVDGSVAVSSDPNKALRDRFNDQHGKDGLSVAHFCDMFHVKDLGAFKRWLQDPGCKTPEYEKAVRRYLQGSSELRALLLEACDRNHETLEEFSRRRRLPLGDVTSWLSSQPLYDRNLVREVWIYVMATRRSRREANTSNKASLFEWVVDYTSPPALQKPAIFVAKQQHPFKSTNRPRPEHFVLERIIADRPVGDVAIDDGACVVESNAERRRRVKKHRPHGLPRHADNASLPAESSFDPAKDVRARALLPPRAAARDLFALIALPQTLSTASRTPTAVTGSEIGRSDSMVTLSTMETPTDVTIDVSTDNGIPRGLPKCVTSLERLVLEGKVPKEMSQKLGMALGGGHK